MKYRLDLNLSELETLKKIIEDIETSDKYKNYYSEIKSFKSLNNMIQKPKEINYSGAKCNAALRATEARVSKAKEKIDNAINILKHENKKITHYSIAKVSNVSFNTIKKHLSDDYITSLNEMK